MLACAVHRGNHGLCSSLISRLSDVHYIVLTNYRMHGRRGLHGGVCSYRGPLLHVRCRIDFDLECNEYISDGF